MKYIIETKNLSKQFRTRGNTNVLTGLVNPKWQYKAAVSAVNLAIERGESVAFLGPNGAGKTTTTKMLTGLIKPTDGSVQILGHEPFSRNSEFLRRIGLVMGNKAGLNWDLTANQSFELLQKIYEISPQVSKKRAKEMSELLSVDHALDKQVRKLSLGERMKLELIGSLLHDPDILFLDEPTIGLDISSKKNVREFLRQMHKAGKTIVLTSHDMDDVSEVCDRVVVINKGKIMFDGSMAGLNHQYSSQKFIRLMFDGKLPNKTEISQFARFVSKNKNHITLSVDQQDVMAKIAEIGKRYTVRDITIESVPLELIVSDLYERQ